MNLIFKDPEFSFQLMRALGYSVEKGSDIGECISTALRIKDGDIESWHDEWLRTAERINGIAEDCLRAGHRVSAQEAFSRASGYYRLAEFYEDVHPGDTDFPLWEKSYHCFNKVRELSNPSFEVIEIPYEGTTLPGYFYSAGGGPKPIIIAHTGFDGTKEELHFQIVLAALRRGYNCLTFDGPGQGEVIRKRGLPFRYDWEKVVTPVVDYAVSRDEVDADRVALMGISMGGYFAPRAAAYDHRIAACIANGGIFDLFEAFANNAKLTVEKFRHFLEKYPKQIDKRSLKSMKKSVGEHWALAHGMWVFGAGSPSEYFTKIVDYSMKECVEDVECHMLVIDTEEEHAFPGQSRKLFDALTCPKDLMVFHTDEGAGLHCQVGAAELSNQRVLDWLDEKFA